MVKLEQCPFCGGESELTFALPYMFTDSNGNPRTIFTYTVKCLDRFCGCSIGSYDSPEMAVEAWNRRTNNA